MSRENALTGTRCDVCGRRAMLLYVASSGAQQTETGAPIYDLVADICVWYMHTEEEMREAAKSREAKRTAVQ